MMMKSWRPGWYLDDWNISRRTYDAYLNVGLVEDIAKFSFGSYEEEIAQSKAKEVPLLFHHLEALFLLFHDNEPALRLIRSIVSIEDLYTFGNPSGSVFGASWKEEDDLGYRIGVCNEEGGGTSSNYQ